MGETLNSKRQNSCVVIGRWVYCAQVLNHASAPPNSQTQLSETVASALPRQLRLKDIRHRATQDRIQSGDWEAAPLPTQPPGLQSLPIARRRRAHSPAPPFDGRARAFARIVRTAQSRNLKQVRSPGADD